MSPVSQRILTFTDTEGNHFYLIHDAYYAVTRRDGHDVLLAVGILLNGAPDHDGWGGLNVVEVTNVDENQQLVNDINSFFGTKFTMKSFPGR